MSDSTGSDGASGQTETARARLRRETGDLHAELDALLSQANFDDARSYAHFLIQQAAPLAGIEAALEAGGISDEIPDWAQRRRLDAIRCDLAALGTPMPAPAFVAPSAGRAERLGALYVLEGSRLGAKYLSRAARASRDPVVSIAVAYLTHGDGQSLWPRFLSLLAAWEENGGDQEKLVAGARDTFALFLAAAKERRVLVTESAIA